MRNFIAQSRTRLRFPSEKTLVRDLMQRVRDGQQRIDLRAESLDAELQQSVARRARRACDSRAGIQAHSPARELVARRSELTELQRASPPTHRDCCKMRSNVSNGSRHAALARPGATLQRGYSITTDAAGRLIRTVAEVARGDTHPDASRRRDVRVRSD